MKIKSVTVLKDIQLTADSFLYLNNGRTEVIVDKSRSKYKEHQLIYQQGVSYGTVGDCCNYLDDEDLRVLEERGLIQITRK
jgi:hypothetical protein